jgi:prepilin-type N-terminal cleavage/methylation domain-containing protein
VKRYPGDRRGFTFFEVMVTVAVLASGLVLVYQSLLTCVEAQAAYGNRLAVSAWMNGKMWEAHERLYQPAEEGAPEPEGEFVLRNRTVSWAMSVTGAGQGLYRIDLSCRWTEGRRAMELSRETYVLCVEEKPDSP